MASVNICDRTSHGRSKRFCVPSVQVDGKVTDFVTAVSKIIGKPPEDIELIYCGQRLLQGKSLSSYGIKTGSTVYALQKKISEDETDAVGHAPEKAEILAALKTDLLNPAYRSIVEKMLTDTETIENIIAATPGLDADPVSISMLQDPELLAILAHPQNISKLLEKHPAFGHAAIAIAAAVSEEGTKDSTRATTGSYSMDQMSDEEDEARPSGAAGGSSITSSQLAAALSAAGSRPGQPGTSGGSQGGPPIISSDFFQQAMMQAQSAATEAQLQQLRDMGISDDNLARRALQATGGDIQAALELIFGDANI